MKARVRLQVCLVSFVVFVSCAKLQESLDSCAPGSLQKVAGENGIAQVFNPDPITASGNPNLSPASLKLDDYRSAVTLNHLGGRGVLEGQYVEVRNGLACKEWFGAFDQKNQFSYSHSELQFQEAMSYHFGDEYRALLDTLGYLRPSDPVRIVAHCNLQDNAYFTKERDSSGTLVSKVCLGDSVTTPGAFYGDDASVTIHELQHATTTDLYAGSQSNQTLNQFWYDEAGALNEAISDFMGMVYLAPSIPASLVPSIVDPLQFGRWALGRFYPNSSGTRGAHRCPEYDAGFSTGCAAFPAFSADTNTIAYIYPDGLGWPYANNFTGPDFVRAAFKTYRHQEEIHNAGILMEGALWDVYENLKTTHDATVAQALSMKLALEAIRHLPKPTLNSLSPVTFRGYASAISSSLSLLGFSIQDQTLVTQALNARGLLGGPTLSMGWAQRGDGLAVTPGLRIEDNPNRLKTWLYTIGSDAKLVTQGIETGLNGQADPGETVALWFDLRNIATETAGGVQLTVSSPDADVTFLDGATNVGPVSSVSAQIVYGKINGSAIVSALNGTRYPVGTGNSYFQTNPFYSQNWQTAIWAKISPTAPHGKVVNLSVKALPSNGDATVVPFPVTIN